MGLFEGLEDQVRFEVVDDLAERESAGGQLGNRDRWRRGLRDLGRQVVDLDFALDAEDNESLYQVLEFAHVARPVVAAEQLHGLGAEAAHLTLLVGVGHLQEVVDQQRNVVPAVSEGRDLDRDHVESVVEILPEAALPDRLLQVLVGSGQHPDIDRNGLRRADGLKGPVLQHPEQLHLEVGAHVPDLVQEDGSAVGHGEAAFAVSDGIGECALHVTEELGLQQFFGDCAAIDRHQHPGRPGAVVVDGPGDELLAGTTFTRDQHRAVGLGHLGDHIEDRVEGRAGSDDVLELVAGLELTLQHPVLGLEAPDFDGLLHQAPDHVEMALVEGLLQVPEGAGA